MSNWISKTERPRNEVFICPHCGSEVRFADSLSRVKENPRVAQCDYTYCPYCGEKVNAD